MEQTEDSERDVVDVVIEYLNEGEWFEDMYDDLLIQGVGCDVTGVSVSRQGVTLHGHGKYGEGATPYAFDPTDHIEALNHESCVSTEGHIVYARGETNDEYPLSLPKHLYFEEERLFESTVGSVKELEQAIGDVLSTSVSLREVRRVVAEDERD